MVIPLTDKQLGLKLREVLERWPLYRELLYKGGNGVMSPPPHLSLYCPMCKKEQLWQGDSESYDCRDGFNTIRYHCRNCGGGQTNYFYYWARVETQPGVYVFFKAGQYPPLEEWIPPALERQLDGQDLDLYKKGLRCRNFNYGVGALAYLRRVVENRMNDILNLISEVAVESGFATEELKQIEPLGRAGSSTIKSPTRPKFFLPV